MKMPDRFNRDDNFTTFPPWSQTVTAATDRFIYNFIVSLHNCHSSERSIRLTTDEAITDGFMTQQAVNESLANSVTHSPVAPAYVTVYAEIVSVIYRPQRHLRKS